jgi:hypothetical protein
MVTLLKTKEKLLLKDLRRKSFKCLLRLMLHQEVLTFHLWTLLFKLNHLKIQRPTFTDLVEQLGLVGQVLVLPFTAINTK